MDTVRRFVVLFIVVLVSVLAPGAVLAQGSRTVYVDDTGPADPSGRGSCGHPHYATIQAAVDDMSAARIIVCRGTYTEQVAVSRSVVLEGRSGAVIQAPAALPGQSSAIVSFAGPQQSLLQGFTITGASTTDERFFAGVEVRDGAQVTMTRNRIRDIPDNSPIFQTGVGIYVAEARADITRNTIERYADHGILLFGGNTFATISGNTIRSPGASGPSGSQIGIDVREGAEADVEDNTITGNTSDFFMDGTGIVVDQTANVSIRDNEIRYNDRGIVLGDETAYVEVRGNKVRNNTSTGLLIIEAAYNNVVKNEFNRNGGDGIALRSGDPPATGNIIDSNKANDNGGNGISLGAGAIGNTVKNNEAIKNGAFDLTDANGGPPANVYINNKCAKGNPPELCED